MLFRYDVMNLNNVFQTETRPDFPHALQMEFSDITIVAEIQVRGVLFVWHQEKKDETQIRNTGVVIRYFRRPVQFFCSEMNE